MVPRLVRLFQDLGGELRLSCPVEEIRTRTGVSSASPRRRLERGLRARWRATPTSSTPTATSSAASPRPRGWRPASSAGATACRCSSSTSAPGDATPARPPRHPLRAPLPGADQRTSSRARAWPRLLAVPSRPTLTDPSSPRRGARRSTSSPPCPPRHGPIDWEKEGPRYRDRLLDYHGEAVTIPKPAPGPSSPRASSPR